MAIKIFCDLCGQEREVNPVNQIMGAEWKDNITMVFSKPRMDHQHFVCLDCLRKIGIPRTMIGRTENTQTDTDEHRPTQGVETSGRDVRKRRRGVEVVLTWKKNGEFEVFSSIAAAVDRIAERTGMVISGADISHALLKERVFNADVFCVRYANAQTETGSVNAGSGNAVNTGNTTLNANGGSAAGKEIHELYVSQNAPDELKLDCKLPAVFATNDVSTAANTEKAAGE